MKKLLFFLLCLGTLAQPRAHAAYRDIVLEKLVFFYVDNPGSALPAPAAMEIDKRTIAGGGNITSPLWTNADNAGLKTLLQELLLEPSRGGNERLQRIVATVLAISSKQVRVFLYHDTGNATADASMPIYCTNAGAFAAAHNQASWPCARMYSPPDSTFSGEIGVGAHFFDAAVNAGGWQTSQEKGLVFVHELVHTQTPLVLESTLTGNMYGPDGGHSLWEMIPSKNSAFNEGIANAFAFRYFLPASFSITTALNNNAQLRVENDPGCSSATVHCLQQRLAADSVPTAAACVANHQCYAIRDISPEVIMHDELISANVLYQIMAQFQSTAMLARATRAAQADMASASNYTFMPLFKELTRQGLNYSNPANPPGTVTHGQFMPLAILDYYTGYKVGDKAMLERVLGTTWAATDTNIDDYFRAHRATLIGFRPNATTWHVGNQLSRLAENLHVRTPASPPTAGTTE